MKKSPSLQTSYSKSVIPKHKDGMGKASLPCIKYRPWGYDTPENQTACVKAYNHMQRLCLWKTSVWLGRASVTCSGWEPIPCSIGSRLWGKLRGQNEFDRFSHLPIKWENPKEASHISNVSLITMNCASLLGSGRSALYDKIFYTNVLIKKLTISQSTELWSTMLAPSVIVTSPLLKEYPW